MVIRDYKTEDLPLMITIWNQVVEDGAAFPQRESLDEATGPAFFAGQDACGVAEEDGEILGLYILHPNNVGRCGHIANASYAVRRDCRGRGLGRKLVYDCLKKAKARGYRLMQFNAVVCSNLGAIHLYESMGFERLGRLPGGFCNKEGVYEDTILFYYDLTKLPEG